MGQIIGQSNLINTLNNLVETDKIPRFMIFVGPWGSGKKTICDYLIRKSKLNHVHFGNGVDDIRQAIITSYEVELDSIYSFYDCDSMNQNALNAMLKVTEEPPKKARFVMTFSHSNKILPTLISRATVFKLSPYTTQQLDEYASEIGIPYKNREFIFNVCDTPGNLNLFKQYDCNEFISHVNKLCRDIGNQKLNETLKITYKINTKRTTGANETNDTDIKWSPYLFMKAVQFQLFHKCTDPVYYNAMCITGDYINKLQNVNSLNIQMLLDAWLIELNNCLKG